MSGACGRTIERLVSRKRWEDQSTKLSGINVGGQRQD